MLTPDDTPDIGSPEYIKRTLELLATLPFVGIASDEGLDLWEPLEDSGNVDADIETGVRYARITLALAREHRNPFVISWVLGDMVKGGRLDNMAAGFITEIAIRTQAASHN